MPCTAPMHEALIDDLPASKIREVANAAHRPRATCSRSGSARATSRRRAPSARPRRSRSPTARPSTRTTSACPSCARRSPATSSRCIRRVGSDRIAVTSSGVSALMLAMQALVGAGDEVVAVVPVWPNLTAQPAILGARVMRVPLRPGAGRRVAARPRRDCSHAVTDRTRVLLVNAPNNPTGWTLTRAEQQAMLAHCRAPARGSSPTRSTSGSTSAAARLRAELPRHRRRRRPAGRRPQLLEELPDDRLAPGLAGAARRR